MQPLFSTVHHKVIPLQGSALLFRSVRINDTGDKLLCFLCTSSGQVRNSESAWRLPFPRRQRSVLHSFSPRNTEGLTHFQRISMWPQGQSHNHGVLMCPALCHCQKLMRLTQCPCLCQVYGHLKGVQPFACSNALLFTNSACSPEASEGH